MDRSRISRAGADRGILGGGARDPNSAARRRIVVYFVVVVLMGAWILRREPPEEILAPAPFAVDEELLPGRRPAPVVEIDADLLSQVRDATASERARLERTPRLHLLETSSRLIYGDLDERIALRHGDRDELQPVLLRPADHDELMNDPAAHRGAPMWVIGRLKWWEADTLDGLYEVRGELEDEDGRSWTFLVASEPRGLTGGGSTDLQPGEVVRLQGFFFKIADLARPDLTFVTAPMIVGRELVRSSFRIPPVTTFDADLRQRVARIQDATLGLAELPLEGPEYYELLSFLEHADDAAYLPEGAVVPEVSPSALLHDPAAWRGRPVRVAGVLLKAEHVPLGPGGENPLGERFVWRLWVSDARAGELGTLLLLGFDAPEGLRPGMILEAEGLFFRRLAYETSTAKAHMASVVLVRDVWPFLTPVDTLTPILVRIVLVGGIVGILFILFGVWRDKSSSRVERTRRMGRMRKLVALPGLLHRREGEAADGRDASGDPGARDGQASDGDAPPRGDVVA